MFGSFNTSWKFQKVLKVKSTHSAEVCRSYKRCFWIHIAVYAHFHCFTSCLVVYPTASASWSISDVVLWCFKFCDDDLCSWSKMISKRFIQPTHFSQLINLSEIFKFKITKFDDTYVSDRTGRVWKCVIWKWVQIYGPLQILQM